MTSLTREKIVEIMEGCEGATPGPYAAPTLEIASAIGMDNLPIVSTSRVLTIARMRNEITKAPLTMEDELNAAHFARLDPATVKALCEMALAAMDAHAAKER